MNTLVVNLSDLISHGINKLDSSFFENTGDLTELHLFQRKIRNNEFEIDKTLLSNFPNLETLSITNITTKEGNIDFITSSKNIKNLQIHSSEYSGECSISSKILLPNLKKVDFEVCTLDEQNSLLSLLQKKNIVSFKLGTKFNLTISELNEFENLCTLGISLPPFPDYKNLTNLKLNKLETLALPSLHWEEEPPKVAYSSIDFRGIYWECFYLNRYDFSNSILSYYYRMGYYWINSPC